MRLGVSLQRGADHRGEFGRGVAGRPEAVAAFGAHGAFEEGGGVGGVGQGHGAGGGTDDDLAVGQGNHRGRQDLAEGIGDQLRSAIAECGDQGIGGAKVDAELHGTAPAG